VSHCVTAALPKDELPSGTILVKFSLYTSYSCLNKYPTLKMSFDLDTYVARYRGHTRAKRLIFIAENSATYCKEALNLAVEFCKNGDVRNSTGVRGIALEIENCKLSYVYKEICSNFSTKSNTSEHVACDRAWLDSTEKAEEELQNRLSNQLEEALSNNIKESIRMAQVDLGNFHYARGDMENALKWYTRTRDYCTNSAHIRDMCLNVIRVCIASNRYLTALTYIPKAEQALKQPDKITTAKLKSAAGLASIASLDFHAAANNFITVPSELGSEFSDLIAPEDIALYGGICALATFDRHELKQKVIENPKFRFFLELMPRVRELVKSFHDSDYKQLLGILKSLETDIKLDIHLSQHHEVLYQNIWKRALIQYVSPYSSVCLKKMAKIFETNVSALEAELAKLIMQDDYDTENSVTTNGPRLSIQARIDSHNKILYARQANDDQREITYRKAFAMGEEFCLEAQASILRANLGTERIVYTASSSSKTK